ncbi:MAG: biopolymer transporter ExbD [Gammaproteobacteria bacterium]|nr:biopolymer transporter ExbD [Gammaproteobacteria bacterium]
MNFHARRVETATVEITPLIDVVFILLIFFMVTSTFVTNSQLEITLPESTNTIEPQIQDAVDVFIDSEGRFSVGGGVPQLTTQSAVMEQMGNVVKSIEDPTIMVHADGETRHQAIVHVLSALSELKIEKVHLVSSQTTRSSPVD